MGRCGDGVVEWWSGGVVERWSDGVMSFDESSWGLTAVASQVNLGSMQMTIEISDKLAQQLEPERERLGEIIARGLRRGWSGASSLRREVISFLARQPNANEILEFRPSGPTVARAQELLGRHQESTLTAEEEAELDELCEVDRFVSLIKAEVLRQSFH